MKQLFGIGKEKLEKLVGKMKEHTEPSSTSQSAVLIALDSVLECLVPIESEKKPLCWRITDDNKTCFNELPCPVHSEKKDCEHKNAVLVSISSKEWLRCDECSSYIPVTSFPEKKEDRCTKCNVPIEKDSEGFNICEECFTGKESKKEECEHPVEWKTKTYCGKCGTTFLEGEPLSVEPGSVSVTLNKSKEPRKEEWKRVGDIQVDPTVPIMAPVKRDINKLSRYRIALKELRHMFVGADIRDSGAVKIIDEALKEGEDV